jgi:hypothetical protein
VQVTITGIVRRSTRRFPELNRTDGGSGSAAGIAGVDAGLADVVAPLELVIAPEPSTTEAEELAPSGVAKTSADPTLEPIALSAKTSKP